MYLISLLLPLFRVYHYLVFLRVSKLGNYSLSVHLLSGLLLKSMWLPEFSLWLRFHILMQCWPSKNFIGICCREKKTCFSTLKEFYWNLLQGKKNMFLQLCNIHDKYPPRWIFFLSLHSDISPNIILRKNCPTKSNVGFV